ncbi:MAG: selenocysteine-specific translation elongation factor [Syntrophaceae bacterium]
MRHLILGTAGHVDHGKTALVKALTGVDTDRLKEEKERGITIELGFAALTLPNGLRLGIIDVPGHEKFVKNMVAGAGGIDIVALIIAADEGVMPQTREHLEICSLLGIRFGLVALTKTDLVESEWLSLVREDIREFLKGTFLEGAPIVPVSAVKGQGIDEFISALEQVAGKVVEEPGPDTFRLPIDRVFTIKGFGTVVTGTIISGRVAVGDNIEIMPARLSAKVRGIQVHNEAAVEAESGQRTAVNIQGLEKETIERGNVLTHQGRFEPSMRMDAALEYLSSAPKKLKNRSLLRFHSGTVEILARVVLLEGDEMLPGSKGLAQIVLESPFINMAGDRFVLRSYSPVRTIGGGRILDPLARKIKKLNQTAIEELGVLQNGPPRDRAAVIIRRSGLAGITPGQLSVRTGLPKEEIKRILAGLISSGQAISLEKDKDGDRVMSASRFKTLQEQAVAEIRKYHGLEPLKEGISREELRSILLGKAGQPGQADPRIYASMLKVLEVSNAIVVDKDLVRLASHRVDLKGDLEEIRSRIHKTYSESSLAPPLLKEVLDSFGDSRKKAQDVISVMLKEGALVKVSEELLYSREALERLRKDYQAYLLKEGKANPAGFKELTGLSRKFIIPLMEYFDKIKLTIRVGDNRVLRDKSK